MKLRLPFWSAIFSTLTLLAGTSYADGISAIIWCDNNNNPPASGRAAAEKMPDGQVRGARSAHDLYEAAKTAARACKDDEAIEWLLQCQWHNEGEQNAIKHDRDKVLKFLRKGRSC